MYLRLPKSKITLETQRPVTVVNPDLRILPYCAQITSISDLDQQWHYILLSPVGRPAIRPSIFWNSLNDRSPTFPTLSKKMNENKSDTFQLFGGKGWGSPKIWKIPIFFLKPSLGHQTIYC